LASFSNVEVLVGAMFDAMFIGLVLLVYGLSQARGRTARTQFPELAEAQRLRAEHDERERIRKVELAVEARAQEDERRRAAPAEAERMVAAYLERIPEFAMRGQSRVNMAPSEDNRHANLLALELLRRKGFEADFDHDEDGELWIQIRW
jgi:hypothetical protein